MDTLTSHTRQQKYIQYGKVFALIFATLLTATSLILYYQNRLLDDRDALLQNTLNLLFEQTALTESLNYYIQQNTLNFDRINHQQKQIAQLFRTLETQTVQNREIQSAMMLLKRHLTKQTTLIDAFKPTVAVIQNSSHYFPVLVQECQKNLTQTDQEKLIESLFIEHLMLKNVWTSDNRDRFSETLTRVKKQISHKSCRPLIEHGQILDTYYTKQFKLFSDILNIPVKHGILNLFSRYESETTALINRHKIYNAVLVLLSFIFLGLMTASLYWLSNINQRLNRTLSDLDQQKNLYLALSKANQQIYQLKNREEVFDLITDIATTYMNVQACWVGVVKPHSDVVTIEAYAGIGKDVVAQSEISIDAQKPGGQGAIGRVYRNGEPVIINQFSNSELMKPWLQIANQWGIHSLASFPIFRGDDIEAVISFYSMQPDFFSQQIVQLIQELIEDIGVALERLKLVEDQQALVNEQRLSATAFESQESILITDRKGCIAKVNKAFCEMSGYREDEVVGQTPRILKSSFHKSDFYQDLWHRITHQGTWQGEMWNRRKDGTLYPIYQTITAVYGESGRINHFVSHSIDLTRLKKAEMEIFYLRNHDNLTGLSNRDYLLQKIETALAHRPGRQNATGWVLVIVNINRFKIYNETLGHLAGDAILVETAKRLRSLQMENVFDYSTCRIGADEFSILCQLEQTSLLNEQFISQQILQSVTDALDKPYQIEQETLHIECTLGVTVFTNEAPDLPESLIQQANTALHRAKLNPKLNIEFFQEEMQRQAIHMRTMELDLTHALQNEEFVLHYQPQVHLKTGKLIGVEALIRWQKSDGSMVMPLQFIPLLESTRLIIPTGHWLLKKALNELAELHNQLNLPVMLAINLSAVQFRDENLLEEIENALEASGFPPDRLELEVTESVLMDDPKDATEIMEKLARLGVKIAIDDFGTGYSSFAYLKQFPVNKLKIDKSFIDDIENPKDLAIVRSIVEMAKAMDITSIAEGLETDNQKFLLEGLGCDHGQGYLYSKPLPYAQLKAFAADRFMIQSRS